MTFEELNLRPQLLRATADCGYTTPTPIQERAVPPALEGRDVMGLAQTGTGKTAAFALPILQRLMDGPRGHVRALIVAPTRELAGQIQEAFADLGKHAKLRSAAIYGGVGMGPQIDKLRRGTEIIVACPGRLLDHIGRGIADLSKVEVLVLDEADRMFDMGFLPDIRKIIARCPANRQTMLFSATMPADIRHLADEILKDPAVVQVNHAAPPSTVSHALYPVVDHLKTPLLLELLKRTDKDSVLVFTRTKHRAKRIAEKLEKEGFSATSLQGNLSQNKREEALSGFKRGRYQVMVATDIAARGIDVSSISHVINFDMPDTAEAYTHRIGRTGRAAKTGDAFTFVTQEDAPMLRAIERLLGERPPVRKVDGFDYALPQASQGEPMFRPERKFGPRGRSDGGRRPAAASTSSYARRDEQRPAGPRSGYAGTADRNAGAPSRRADCSTGARTDRQSERPEYRPARPERQPERQPERPEGRGGYAGRAYSARPRTGR